MSSPPNAFCRYSSFNPRFIDKTFINFPASSTTCLPYSSITSLQNILLVIAFYFTMSSLFEKQRDVIESWNLITSKREVGKATCYDLLARRACSGGSSSRSNQEWHLFLLLIGFHTLRMSWGSLRTLASFPLEDERSLAIPRELGPSSRGSRHGSRPGKNPTLYMLGRLAQLWRSSA